jgi:protein phosphatase 2C family protein 2/3
MGLSVARSLGDNHYNETHDLISAVPDISSRVLPSETEFLAVCCDGVWDVLSNEQVSELLEQPDKRVP